MRSQPWWWRRLGLHVVMLVFGILAIIWGSATGTTYGIVLGCLIVVRTVLVIRVMLHGLRNTPRQAEK